MAAILPNSAPVFDRNDLAGTVRALCGQFQTFQENVDFHLGQFKKELESLGGLAAGLESGQKALEGQQTALETRVAGLEKEASERPGAGAQ